jgi:glycosyltransferase involved in cell wall biosynthesis
MKINFILNMMGISGGVKDVFMFAHQLKLKGHDVNVIYPVLPIRVISKLNKPRFLANEIVGLLLDRFRPTDWYKDVTVKKVLSINNVPDADICVATHWETSYIVANYPKSKGEKFYLIQDFENWYTKDNDVIQTYRLGLHNIVHSQWLRKIVEQYSKIDAVIPHAPDHDQFYPEPMTREPNAPIRVLMSYRPEKWKWLEQGKAAYDRVKDKLGANMRLIMFGNQVTCQLKVDEYYFNPAYDQLRNIYNSSDIFVFTSEREGWGVPPMEAMACSVPVVTTNVGGVPEYTIPGKTAIVIPPGDLDAIEKGIETLVLDSKLRQELGTEGYNYMKRFTWENSARELEALFKQYKS